MRKLAIILALACTCAQARAYDKQTHAKLYNVSWKN
jgi:hypothetical protein